MYDLLPKLQVFYYAFLTQEIHGTCIQRFFFQELAPPLPPVPEENEKDVEMQAVENDKKKKKKGKKDEPIEEQKPPEEFMKDFFDV